MNCRLIPRHGWIHYPREQWACFYQGKQIGRASYLMPVHDLPSLATMVYIWTLEYRWQRPVEHTV